MFDNKESEVLNQNNNTHFLKVKSVCNWLKSIDSNGVWEQIYIDWENMDDEDRLTELEYLMSTLTEYRENEEREDFLHEVDTALTDIRKIEYEILEGKK